MTPRLLPYFFRQALANIRMNRTVHLIGLGTMVVSMSLVGAFLLLFFNINAWLKSLRQPLTISVYLKDGIDLDARRDIEAFISRIPGAKIDRFISKQEAFNDLKKALGPDARLLDSLEQNPLPASYEIQVKTDGKIPPELKKITDSIQRLKGVLDVQCSELQQKRIEGIIQAVSVTGIVIGSLICLGTVFIVTNTIKLSIYARREEVEILKLSGATDWFVKMPFLLEGLVQGVSGGLITLAVLYLFYLFLHSKKIYILNLTMFELEFLPVEYVAGLLILSVILGIAGSMIAIGRLFDTFAWTRA